MFSTLYVKAKGPEPPLKNKLHDEESLTKRQFKFKSDALLAHYGRMPEARNILGRQLRRQHLRNFLSQENRIIIGNPL